MAVGFEVEKMSTIVQISSNQHTPDCTHLLFYVHFHCVIRFRKLLHYHFQLVGDGDFGVIFFRRLAPTERCLNFIVLILEHLVDGVPSPTQISLAITQPPLEDRMCGFNSVSCGATKMSNSI